MAEIMGSGGIRSVPSIQGGHPEGFDGTELYYYLGTGAEISVERTAGLLAAADRGGAAAPGRHSVDQSDEKPEESEEHELVRRLEKLYWLAQAESVLGDPNTALSHIAQGLRVAKRQSLTGIGPRFATALSILFRQPPGDALVRDRRDEALLKLNGLGGRELQIARLVSDGFTNEQIARKLELSAKTVETYLARIFKKLTVSCRAEIAAIVGRSGSSYFTRVG